MASPTLPPALQAAKTSDAATIVETVKSLHGHTLIDLAPDTSKVALVPSGMKLESLKELADEWRLHPERVEQTVAAGTVDSLIDYIKRFQTLSTLGFYDANDVRAVLVALDFHDATSADAPKASHVTHLATYRFPLSDELLAWLEFASMPRHSPEFAEFLLDRAHDVESPPIDWMLVEAETVKNVLDALNLHDDRVPSSIGKDQYGNYVGVEELAREFRDRFSDPETSEALDGEPADDEDIDGPTVPRTAIYKLRKIRFASAHTIVSLARSVQINSTSKARAAYDPKSGNTSILFEEDSQATTKSGQRVKLPDGFFLYIPVFRGEPPRLIPCRLKHRVRGTVLWQVEIADINRLIDRAITHAAERVAAETGITMLRGLPVGQSTVAAITAEPTQVKAIAKLLEPPQPKSQGRD